MIIGFTGTREGMTGIQKEIVESFLEMFDEVHHGMCIGADEEFHGIAKEFSCTIIGHPGIPKSGQDPIRAKVECDRVLPEKYYVDRDKDIAEIGDVLVAAPKGPEEKRSGTWTTIRHARKNKKKVVIVYPDGHTRFELKDKVLEI